jgi:hypothetical protein
VIAYTVGSSQNCKRLLPLPALDGNDDDDADDVAFLRILLCELVLA